MTALGRLGLAGSRRTATRTAQARHRRTADSGRPGPLDSPKGPTSHRFVEGAGGAGHSAGRGHTDRGDDARATGRPATTSATRSGRKSLWAADAAPASLAAATPGPVSLLERPADAAQSARGAGKSPATGAGNRTGNSAGTASGNLEAVARGGALSMVGALVSAVANLALTVVITHGVGRSTAGEFFALTSVFLLAEVLCRLGADVGLIYFLARWRTLGRFEAMRIGLRVGMQPPLIFAVVIGAVMFAAADPLSRWVGAGTHGVGLLRLLAVALPIVVVYDLSLAATRGWARMRPTVLIDKIVRPVGQLALVAGVIFLGWKSLIGVGWAVPYFAAAVASVAALRALPWRKTGRYEGPVGAAVAEPTESRDDEAQTFVAAAAADARPAVAREFWRFTAPRAVAAVAQLLLQRLDIVLVAALRGPVDAAVYTAATRFLVVGQFVNMALVAPAQPRLSALLASRDIEGTRELFQTTTSWLVVFVWPMYLAIAVLAPTYLHVFGSGYSAGLWVVILLCLAMMVASAVGFVDVILLMVGKSGWNMGTTVAALVIDAGLDIVLIPRIGIVGAAIGWCGAILAANLVPGLLVMRLVGIHPFSRATLTSIAITTTCFAVIPLAVGLPLGGGQLALLSGVGVGTLIYAAALWRLRHTLLLHLAATAIMRRKR